MKRYGARFRLYAWMSVFVTLFSAVSPALAAAVLADRPAALGQMLGLPAPAAAEAHHGAGHAGHHGDPDEHGAAPAPSDDDTAHRAHGIYCSFCLNATSTVAIGAAPPAVLLHSVPSFTPAAERECPAAAASHPFFRSRAPPAPAPFLPV
jgi:hypothetical protein